MRPCRFCPQSRWWIFIREPFARVRFGGGRRAGTGASSRGLRARGRQPGPARKPRGPRGPSSGVRRRVPCWGSRGPPGEVSGFPRPGARAPGRAVSLPRPAWSVRVHFPPRSRRGPAHSEGATARRFLHDLASAAAPPVGAVQGPRCLFLNLCSTRGLLGGARRGSTVPTATLVGVRPMTRLCIFLVPAPFRSSD